MTTQLQELRYGLDLVILGAPVVELGAFAFLAGYVLARCAASVDPIGALRDGVIDNLRLPIAGRRI